MVRFVSFLAVVWVVWIPSAVALDCTLVTGNLVPACGVADAGEAGSWVSNGSGATLAYSNSGNPPGSLSADAGPGVDITEWLAGASSACFQILPSTEYSVGMEFSQQSGGASVSCDVALQYYSDAACATTLTATQVSPDVTVDNGSWTLLSGTITSDALAGSARVTNSCQSTEDYVVLFDNAITRPGSTIPVELQRFTIE